MDKEINILPIFDQSAPAVWDDFVRIRVATRAAVYSHVYTPADIRDAYSEHRESWNRKVMNFAFGAYDGAEMVGFINGESNRYHATIQNLYVLPAYRGMRLGRQLLRAAERGAGLNSRDMNLVALGGACSFYEKMGYTSPTNTNKYIKKINGGGQCGVVPVFKTFVGITRVCDQICQGSISPKLADNTVPMFVYVDAYSNPQGFIIDDKDNNQPRMYIKPNNPADWISGQLMRKFDSYKSVAAIRGGRIR